MSDRIASFDQIIPSRLAAGEEYATVSQILECDDLPQATLHIPQWRINGKPAAIRVRALSLTERESVLRLGDAVAQHCMAWQIGCISPAFNADQASRLASKNPHAVEQGARFILLLSALDQEMIDRVATAQTNAEPAADATDGAPAADSSSTADTNDPPRA